jgi:predicted short-subunit dehydrogenase-like oxidoreductase (DUF2520 family)
MRQVPRYLIIGDGRVARHFQYYFSLLHLSYTAWHRAQPIEKLQKSIPQATHILILIKDHAIDTFCETYLQNTTALCIHFSGSHISSYAFGAHPLMTFHHDKYTLDDYLAIPFVVDHDAPEFERLLPGISNKNIRLNKLAKAKYHALCVMSGNFSCILWQKLFASFEEEFNMPSTFAHPYLRQQTQNLLSDAKSALTGPLVRNDNATIQKNITALENDPFQEIYLSFVECYKKISEVKHECS